MTDSQSKTIRLGAFVVLAIALFTFGVYQIGDQQNLFGNQFTIRSFFSNVNGLQAGNNVRYAGINVGSVQEILIHNDSTLEVVMKLQKKVQPFIKKDAIASIGTDGLVGNMIVNINPGNSVEGPVKDGESLRSFTRVETGAMLNSLGNTTENIALLTLNLLEISESINRGTGSASLLINDGTLARDLQDAIRQLKGAAANVQALSQLVQENALKTNAGEGLLGFLLRDTSFKNQIHRITSHLDTLILVRTQPTLDHLEKASRSLAASGKELERITGQLQLDQGLVGTLLRDTMLSEELKATVHQLNLGTDQFRENMDALKHNFLFRRYFRKLEREKRKKPDQPTAQN